MFKKITTAISSAALLSTSALLLGRTPDESTDRLKDIESSTSLPRIAVVGGGIGGTSCAYFLRELFGDAVQIDLYEDHCVGGRLRTLPVDGRDYEFGGSIIHPRNKYMVDYTKKFGVDWGPVRNPCTTIVGERGCFKVPYINASLKHNGQVKTLSGAYNGEEFVFEESSWTLITGLRMMWRYGWKDVWMLGQEVSHMMKTFASIYDLQAKGQAFSTLREMMNAMGGEEFIQWTVTPMDQVFREKKFSEKFIAEVVSLATRVSYGQDPNMSTFAGSVALAGVESGLWAVKGGNKLVAEKFLAESVKTSIHRRVTKVTLQPPKGGTRPVYQLTHDLSEDPSTTEYDIVVVAAPLYPGITPVPVKFEGFPAPIGPFPGEYQTTVTTYIKGTLNPEAFGKEPGDYLPEAIITTRDIDLKIRSVAKNYPVDVKTGDKSTWAYKIFSERELNSKELGRIFSDLNAITRVSWQAYPLYQNVDLDRVAPFKLHEGLFHVNAVEWAASCMEMSVIGAKNVALLAEQYWAGEEEGKHSCVVVTDNNRGKLASMQ